ncbi:hypothetical protein AWV80_06710 [Cupriavidus sp. UYMU48A]|nr:hypothetical protein AWV80_06710 [Cupriavidus sp. UYMU48A]
MRQVWHLHIKRVRKIGDGSADAQHAMMAARGPPEPGGRGLQERGRRAIERRAGVERAVLQGVVV